MPIGTEEQVQALLRLSGGVLLSTPRVTVR